MARSRGLGDVYKRQELTSSRPFNVGGNVRQRFAITDSDPFGR
jgi:hypothetical protein